MHLDNRHTDADSECRVFCRYLIGSDPTEYVIDTYCGAKELKTASSGASDVALLEVARRGPWLARAADAYASVFARRSTLRRRLILLMAILESVRASSDVLDTADAGSYARFVGRSAVVLSHYVVLFLAGSILVGATMVGRRLGTVLSQVDRT